MNYPSDTRSPIRFTPRTFIVRVEGIELPVISTLEDQNRYGTYFIVTPEGSGHLVSIYGEEKFFDLNSLRHDLKLLSELYAEECAEVVLEQDYV
jgi:hypothetical protein